MKNTVLSFNPYYYWSYLLTVDYREEEDIENYVKGFNPYYYWSYLLTLYF